MKTLFALLAACGIASAADTTVEAFDTTLTTRNGTNTGNINYFVDKPSANGLYIYDFTNSKPHIAKIGFGLTWDTGTDSVAVDIPALDLQIGDVSGLQAALDLKLDIASAFDGTWVSLTGKPSTFAPSAHTHLWGDITGTPTTVAGYGITNFNSLGDARWFLIPAGTTAQYLRGDGTTATFPTNNTAFTNGAGYLTAEVDDSTTNEIELPSQIGNSGRILTTNGSVPSWATVASLTSRSFAAPSRSVVTSTSATGFQISSTRDAQVNYEGTFSTTSTIGGPAGITIFLETADTNSTTPGDWTIVARQVNSNTITLAVILQQTDVEPWSFSRIIPAGKFVRIRSGSVSGTASAAINAEQQEVQF